MENNSSNPRNRFAEIFGDDDGKNLPIVIAIKNKTDEKIYDVKLFEDDYKNHPKLEYFSTSDYACILKNMHKSLNFGSMMVDAECDYYKFQKKQLNCPVYFWEKDLKGRSICYAKILLPDPYQCNVSTVMVKINHRMDTDTNIIFDYIMPNTTIKIYLWENQNSNENESKIKESIPYVLEVKNLTDEKIFDVKLFDFEYEKLDKSKEKIRYNMLPKNVTYQQFLSEVVLRGCEIGLTVFIASCDYEKYQTAQINSHGLIINQDEKRDLYFLHDPYQAINDMVISHKNIKINAQSNIILDYLLPETSMRIFFFPVIIGENKEKEKIKQEKVEEPQKEEEKKEE